MDNKFEEYLSSFLFNLNGKINKSQFKKIVKFYGWKLDFKSIHIVGTNGKGSNAKYLNDELILQGYKVGLFTSPHIFYMYERIKINDNNIDFETLVKYTSDLQSDFPKFNFGFFDLFFLSALRWFNDREVEIAIFEAGIGAKKDIVNYLNHNITLFTSIDIDHQNILGKTIEKITKDKACAIKKDSNVYISDAIDKKLIDILINKAKEIEILNKPLIVKTNKNTFESTNIDLSKFVLKQEFNINEYKSFFKLPIGRVQEININNHKCFVDVAHNLQGIKASINYFKKHNINFDQVVLSLSNDKEHDKIISELKKHFQNIYIYENKGRKPLKFREYSDNLLQVISLNAFCKKLDCPTLFIGSFYLVSEILLGVQNNK